MGEANQANTEQRANDLAALLHPSPLPQGEGAPSLRPSRFGNRWLRRRELSAQVQAVPPKAKRSQAFLPLLKGEGRGEGEEPVQILNGVEAHAGVRFRFLTHFNHTLRWWIELSAVELTGPASYPQPVRTLKHLILVVAVGLLASSANAATAKLVKVLPHFLDLQGRIALNPSLYERDAYQFHLRAHPEERSGLRFDVQWRSRDARRLRLRVELRGNRGRDGTTVVIEDEVKYRGLFTSWSRVSLTGEAYKKFGELSAWRATLWDGDQEIAEQKSFLW